MAGELIGYKVSVREIVEFVFKHGDIESSGTMYSGAEAMARGTKLHKKIQSSMGEDYRDEVTLNIETVVSKDDERIVLDIEGRADGIFEVTGTVDMEAEAPPGIYIDEIKTMVKNIYLVEEPDYVHLAQGMCYAYIYAKQNELDHINVRITYCNSITEEVRYFYYAYEFSYLKDWFEEMVSEYGKWMIMDAKHKRERDESIGTLQFPFEYRDGQRDLVAGVYKSIKQEKRLFIEAPTGVGKTISTVFPAVRTMHDVKTEKIFYLTAKTIARTVAENTFQILSEHGADLKFVTLTSKEKICILEKPDCNPISCRRACGHFDRINECVYELVTHEKHVTRQVIEQYAEEYCVCPFELSLDVSLWLDAIVCDYNYVFDPTSYLKRFFADEAKHNYVFLIDEAHNLVERGREMYSACLIKEDFTELERLLGADANAGRVRNAIKKVNKNLLAYKRECDEFQVWDNANDLINALNILIEEYLRFFEKGFPVTGDVKEKFLDVYFNCRTFLEVAENMDEDYEIYSDYDENGHFRFKLCCMEPGRQLRVRMDRALSSILFSATLLPIAYYKEQLGGEPDDYAVYAKTPFDPQKRLMLVASDASAKYTRRNDLEYARIRDYITKFTGARKGNYLVFFPSYRVMEEVCRPLIPQMFVKVQSTDSDNVCDEILNEPPECAIEANTESDSVRYILQRQGMTEADKEEFLQCFDHDNDQTTIGLCVMGGIFSEGIDLTGERLIGAVIVGTGLPMVCDERELFKYYFDEKNGMGFEYAYLYPSANKVQQSAGRVIRTTEDIGAVLLLDERFLNSQYNRLFPKEWEGYSAVTIHNIEQKLSEFWYN